MCRNLPCRRKLRAGQAVWGSRQVGKKDSLNTHPSTLAFTSTLPSYQFRAQGLLSSPDTHQAELRRHANPPLIRPFHPSQHPAGVRPLSALSFALLTPERCPNDLSRSRKWTPTTSTSSRRSVPLSPGDGPSSLSPLPSTTPAAIVPHPLVPSRRPLRLQPSQRRPFSPSRPSVEPLSLRATLRLHHPRRRPVPVQAPTLPRTPWDSSSSALSRHAQ